MQNKNKENVSYQVVELVLQFLDASFSGQGGASLVQRGDLVAMLKNFFSSSLTLRHYKLSCMSLVSQIFAYNVGTYHIRTSHSVTQGRLLTRKY